MSVLFGHPCGNPNSHHAALALHEAGLLHAFCVPWMPSERELATLRRIPPLRSFVDRLSRRRFQPLDDAPKIQGKQGEMWRMARRLTADGGEGVSYEANDWLMRTMRRACRANGVTAVHAYEDCALWQFEEAKLLGRACIYDMPIGFYPYWQEIQDGLARCYSEWVPPEGLENSKYVRIEQKLKELALADLVLCPSSFVQETVRERCPNATIATAAYGVDADFWKPRIPTSRPHPKLRFIFVGQASLRKGTPLLIEAWRRADLQDAELMLVGMWQLSARKRRELPNSVRHVLPCSRQELRSYYQQSNVFVLPSNFEGLALVLLEAMACRLPVIASDATGATDVLSHVCGRVIPRDNLDALVEALRWAGHNRDDLAEMGVRARERALEFSWSRYRRQVVDAVRPFA